jgi:Glycosyltransferases involved in cell wall biogenesis
MTAKISIIIPVYGVEDYIERCAESLFDQTMKELEFIFVDDCSPDRSVEVLGRVLEKHPERKDCTKIVRLEKNGGVDNARRKGMEAASCDYIQFIDSDDWVEPDMMETMYRAAVGNNADITICRHRRVYGNGEAKDAQTDKVDDRDDYLAKVISLSTNDASPNIFNKLFSREVLGKIKHLPIASIAEDWVMCVQATFAAERIVSLDRVFYNYRIRETSLSHSSAKEECLRINKADMANISLIERFLKEEGLDRKYKDALVARKFIAKGSIESFAEEPEMYKIWKSIYREVNGKVLFNPYITPFGKKAFILRMLKLRSKYLKADRALRKLLHLKELK